MRIFDFLGVTAAVLIIIPGGHAELSAQSETSIVRIASKDGTPIATECAGSGPNLVIVHGGTGDRTRWRPSFPLLSPNFTVCAMDRRGHGKSGDSPDYTLQQGAEDVVAIVNSRPGPVFVLGHSIGGVCALEAAFLSDKISRLVLYEPPLQDRNHGAVATKMENMIKGGQREQALVHFPAGDRYDLAGRDCRNESSALLAGAEKQIREIRALDEYRFDAKRASALKVPTLFLTGSKTASPDPTRAIELLIATLPNRSLTVFEGQEHNAMDTVPREFAEVVTKFLLDARSKPD